MPFKSQKQALRLSPSQRQELEALVRSRTQSVQRVERAEVLLRYADGQTISAIARKLGTNRPKVNRCVDKALELGIEAALQDLPGRGKKACITPEARAWVVSLACRKANELGYAQELWTTRLLAQHVREHCQKAGHPSLQSIRRGTVHKILARQQLKPHKVRYYVENRDPDFERKMAHVLCVYHQVQMLREKKDSSGEAIAILSFDEKPHIQAIGRTSTDRPPVPGKHPAWLRDYEYVRHGTLTLLSGIDLLSGRVHAHIVEHSRSQEFIEFLKQLDQYYPESTRIRMILDNHSTHLSKETRNYLKSQPNRFEFIFTPKHGSWLNIIESFFAKLAKVFLKGLRVSSKAELKQRLQKYLEELNQTPVPFRWKYGLDALKETSSLK